MRIGSAFFDCRDFATMAAFWQEALHYVPREPPGDGWVVLRDPTGRGVNVSVNQKRRTPLGRIRLHLDLYTADQHAEVQRLLALGATIVRGPQQGRDCVILADPEGNHFCVVAKDDARVTPAGH